MKEYEQRQVLIPPLTQLAMEVFIAEVEKLLWQEHYHSADAIVALAQICECFESHRMYLETGSVGAAAPSLCTNPIARMSTNNEEIKPIMNKTYTQPQAERFIIFAPLGMDLATAPFLILWDSGLKQPTSLTRADLDGLAATIAKVLNPPPVPTADPVPADDAGAPEIVTEPLDMEEMRSEAERFQIIDVDAFLKQHAIIVNKRPSPRSRSQKWEVVCPFNHEHKRANILQSVTGIVTFNCFHNSCKEKGWGDVLALFRDQDGDGVQQANDSA